MWIRRIVEDFECRLRVLEPERVGAAATGKAERERFGGGDEELEVRVRSLDVPDGTVLSVHLRDGLLGSFEVRRGRGSFKLDSRAAETVPIGVGDRLVVRLGATDVLSGEFRED